MKNNKALYKFNNIITRTNPQILISGHNKGNYG